MDEDDIPKPGQEEAYYKNRNAITNCLGSEIKKDVGRFNNTTNCSGFAAEVGDIIILTTDGIHDNLTRPQIEEIISRAVERRASSRQIVRDLILHARAVAEAGKEENPRAKQDDMTAVVIAL